MIKGRSEEAISFEDTKTAFALKSDAQLRKAFFLFKVISINFLVKIGPKLTEWALKIRLPISPIIKATLFQQFCGGETIEESMNVIQALGKFDLGSILDYSIEGEDNEEVFDHTRNEIIETLKMGAKNEHIPLAVFKVTGLGNSEIIALGGNESSLNNLQKLELFKVKERILAICQTAYDLNIPVMIDAEESWLQPFIDMMALSMMEKFNTVSALIINTYQMYRHDRLEILKQDLVKARKKGFYLGVKLVRGAYMEKERARALKMSYPSPIHDTKKDTDEAYNKALELCVENVAFIKFVSGTHNEESCIHLVRLMQGSIPNNHPHIYFSQLLGMSDHISFNLALKGYNVAKYVPYGPLKSVLPYLFRRAQENTAISGQMGRELSLISAEIQRRKEENRL